MLGHWRKGRAQGKGSIGSTWNVERGDEESSTSLYYSMALYETVLFEATREHIITTHAWPSLVKFAMAIVCLKG